MIFKCSDYKAYLKSRLAGKGEKRAFAEYIGCQQSFLSQVLKGKPDLSLEHGLLANEYLQHSKDESKHFLLMLHYGRASSVKLRNYYLEELHASAGEQEKLNKKVDPSAREISQHARGIYYSSWVYGATHMLAALEGENQVSFICQKLKIKRDEVSEVLRFLLEQGLITESNGRYLRAQNRIHIPANDPLVLNHHRNYRMRAMEELRSLKSENLHYSHLITLSKNDVQKIKELLLNLAGEVDKILIPSPDEVACQLNFDFFSI